MRSSSPSVVLRRFTRFLLWLLLFAVVTVGCNDTIEPVTDLPVGEASPPPMRSSDGLLENPALQAIAEHQVARRSSEVVGGFGGNTDEARRRAAFALASIQNRDTRLDAELRLQDPNPDIRSDVAFALGRIGDPAAGPALQGALASETDPSVRAALFDAIGHAAGPEVLDAVRTMDVPAEEVAQQTMAVARGGLRDIHPPETLAWLGDALGHTDPNVRIWAAWFFERMPSPELIRALAPRLRSALDQTLPEDPTARRLLPALARLEDVADTERISQWVALSRDWRTRAVAVAALRDRAGSEEARVALLRALDDPSQLVVEAAAQELGRSRPALIEAREEVYAWVDAHPDAWQAREHLLTGMAPLGAGERVAAWFQATPDSAGLERAAALGVLGRIPGQDYLDVLFEAASDSDERVAAMAMRALSGHWGTDREDPALRDRYAQAFRAGLQRGHPTLVGTAATSLTDPLLLEEGAGAWLEQALLSRDPTNPDDAEATRAILLAFADTRDTIWVGLLGQYVQHPSRRVAEAAAESLMALTQESVSPTAFAADPTDHLEIDWEYLAEAGPTPRVEVITDLGRLVFVLAPEEAPLSVQTFLRLVDNGDHDGVPFHRVVPNFVAQGGDVGRRDGTGGPGFAIRTELTTIPFVRGVLGAASAGKDTEGSQYFIMHGAAPHLDGSYTSFGWVEEGMDVADRLVRGSRVITMRRMPG